MRCLFCPVEPAADLRAAASATDRLLEGRHDGRAVFRRDALRLVASGPHGWAGLRRRCLGLPHADGLPRGTQLADLFDRGGDQSRVGELHLVQVEPLSLLVSIVSCSLAPFVIAAAIFPQQPRPWPWSQLLTETRPLHALRWEQRPVLARPVEGRASLRRPGMVWLTDGPGARWSVLRRRALPERRPHRGRSHPQRCVADVVGDGVGAGVLACRGTRSCACPSAGGAALGVNSGFLTRQ